MSEQRRSQILPIAIDAGETGLSQQICKTINAEGEGLWTAAPVNPDKTAIQIRPDVVILAVNNLTEQSGMLKDAFSRWQNLVMLLAIPSARFAQDYSTAISLGADHVLPFDSAENLTTSALTILGKVRDKIKILQPEFRTKLPFAVAITDKHGKVLFWNDIAEQLFGHATSEMTGKKASDVIGPELNFIEAILQTNEMTGEGEVRFKRPSGEDIICLWRARPRPLGEGITIVFDDISSRVQVENELREAIRSADAAFRAKSEFLAVMSHEIRTPMNSIIGFTELLLDTPVDKRQRDYMEIVRSNGITLLELINNVLEFSRIESGKVEVNLAPVDLAELVAGIIDSMWVEASRKGIELYSRIQDDVPQKVMAVEQELRRIILNLVSNGVKFTEHGAVQVFAQVLFADDKHFLLFQVNDTGIGIDPEKADRLFKSFSQIDSSSTRRYGGTGLGLAISKKLCESMGGRMWMQSTPGKGSTFYFTMPLVTVDNVALPKPSAEKHDETATPTPPTIERALSILVAEDEPMNQLLVKRFLSKLGQSCDLANNGREAVERLKSNKYDLVLMDVQMPEMDGIHAAKAVRSGTCGEERRGIYICALTAYAMAGDQERCIDAGMNDYLSKPLTLPSLRRAIERASTQLFGTRG